MWSYSDHKYVTSESSFLKKVRVDRIFFENNLYTSQINVLKENFIDGD